VDRALARAVRSDVARWILFLQTDLEYHWPAGPLDQFGCYNWPMNLLTLGWWERRKEGQLRAWERHGDSSVWPFLTREEFAGACRAPTFLVGSS